MLLPLKHSSYHWLSLCAIHKLYIQAGSIIGQASLDSGTGLFTIQMVLKADTIFQDPVYFTLLPF